MKKLLSLSLFMLLAVPAAAHAHGGGPQKGGPVGGVDRWEIGANVTGMTLRDGPKASESDEAYGGMGVSLRYRMNRRWGLELAVSGVTAELEGGTSRDLVPGTASLMYYLFPSSRVQIYGLAGLGAVAARWYETGSDTTIGASTGGMGQLGVGLMLDLFPVRLHADVRSLVLAPSEERAERVASAAEALPGCDGQCNPAPPSGHHAFNEDDVLRGSIVTLGASLVW